MEAPDQGRRVRFGPFEVNLRAGELYKHGRKIKLQEQPFQVLALLLEHPGEVVTREELRQKLWPADTFVDFDAGLNSATKKIRDALADSAESPRYVETLPRRGYRLIASVEDATPTVTPGALRSQGAPPGAQAEAASIAEPARDTPAGAKVGLRARSVWGVALAAVAAVMLLLAWGLPSLRQRAQGKTIPPKIQSLAVLPLENLSGDPGQQYFTDGMTEALTTSLAQIQSLRVISRTSAMQFRNSGKSLPEIAKALGVDAVVEGSVVRSGNRVRIDAQLIQASRDRHLWAKSYERDIQDALVLQGELARTIASEVRAQLTPKEQTRLASARAVNPEALEAYLKGRYELDRWNGEKSVEYFKQALQHDPTYAQAWAGLSDAYRTLSSSLENPLLADGTQVYLRAKAKAAALKALELDETLSEAHVSLGDALIDLDWSWGAAEKEFQRAIALDANNARAHQAYGFYLLALARFDEAIGEMKRARELDPLGTNKQWSLAFALLGAGRYQEALQQYRETFALGGEHGHRTVGTYPAHRQAGIAYERKGMEREALAELVAALKAYAKAQRSLGEERRSRAAEDLAALVEQKYLSSGYSEAKKVFLRGDIRDPIGPISMAADYADLGEKDKAFEWLNKAIQQRDSGIRFLKVNQRLVALRSDPRFQELLRRLGLPP